MKVIITSKNFSASDHLKQIIESKFEKLGKYFSKDIVANVTLSVEKGRQKLEATINAKGTIFRAEEETSDVYAGVDKVVDKLAAQMSRFKTKLLRKHKDNKEFAFADLPDPQESEEVVVVKRKKFDLIPMTVEESIMQMELLEHNFYVYLDMDSETVNVVYKRKDGDYGVLEPSY